MLTLSRQLMRLLGYLAPYGWQFLPSVLLLAGVGFLDAFRVLLVGPVLDRVLNPASGSSHILLFSIPHTDHRVINEGPDEFQFYCVWWDTDMSERFVARHAGKA